MTVKKLLNEAVDKTAAKSMECMHNFKAHSVALKGMPNIYSTQFYTDGSHGITDDFEVDQIRYRMADKGGIFKMRAGKFFRKLLEEHGFEGVPDGKLDEIVTEFAEQWAKTVTEESDRYELIVDDDFRSIYTAEKCDECIPSCMFNRNLWKFYRDSVKAKACRLIDKERGENRPIVARCVLFTEVHEEGSDKIWKLGERQYAPNDYLRRLLVDSLVKGGYVDGYKKIGAGCGDSRAFVTPSDESLADKKFWINVEFPLVCDDEPYSYQDSFKWFLPPDPKEGVGGRAYNYSKHVSQVKCLDNTDGRFKGWLDQVDGIRVNEKVYNVYDRNGNFVSTRLKNIIKDYVLFNGDYYHHDALAVDYKGVLTPKKQMIQLPDGRWAHYDDVVYPYNGDGPVLRDDAVESALNIGRWWKKTECIQMGDIWMHRSEITRVCSTWGHVQV